MKHKQMNRENEEKQLRKYMKMLTWTDLAACTCRNMLEEVMDDEDELREMNLLSRPRREERRKLRERERLERELERWVATSSSLARAPGASPTSMTGRGLILAPSVSNQKNTAEGLQLVHQEATGLVVCKQPRWACWLAGS